MVRSSCLLTEWLSDETAIIHENGVEAAITQIPTRRFAEVPMNVDPEELIYREDTALPRPTPLALYAAVGWGTYTRDPKALPRAVAGSTCALSAGEGERLVGLVRALSDDVYIA